MNNNSFKTLIGFLFLLGGSVFTMQAKGQLPTITSPAEGAIISSLTTITGTKPSGMTVKISIGKLESDEVWYRPAKGKTFVWFTGPTGQWLPTTSLKETAWSAPTPDYYLPNGAQLPPGRYVIHYYAVSTKGTKRQTEQSQRIFTVQR